MDGYIRSFEANATLSANRIVSLAGNHSVGLCNTSTARPFGLIEDQVNPSVGAAVLIKGVGRVVCFASVSAGSLLAPASDGSGMVVERATTTAHTVGYALEAGSTNSVINIMVDCHAES